MKGSGRSATAPEKRQETLQRYRSRPPEFEAIAGEHVLQGAGHVFAGEPEGVQELSPRELEVLVLTAKGLTTKQIAARLFVANETVASHLLNLRRKLRAQNKAHAVALGFQLGLFSETGSRSPVPRERAPSKPWSSPRAMNQRGAQPSGYGTCVG